MGTFVWKSKPPRLKLEKLQLPLDEGGLALPNIMFYHASQLKYTRMVKKKLS